MFGHRALKALAQNISGVKMAAPFCRIVQVAGMIPERPKTIEGGNLGHRMFRSQHGPVMQLASFTKISQQKKDRKIGLLFSRFRFVEGWHCLV